MKRFLLSLLIVPLLLIGGFSSAYEYGPVINYNGVQQVQVPSGALGLEFFNVSPDGGYFAFEFNCGSSCNPSNIRPSGYYTVGDTVSVLRADNNEPFRSFAISCLNQVNGSWVNCNDTQSLQFKFFYPDPPLVSGTFSNFTPVIDGISDVTTEFIPYVVYIGIGTLLVSLGFIAVKWLVNWLVRKITVIFKSKRG